MKRTVMKKKSCFVWALCALAGVPLVAATPAEKNAARAELLAGVKTIDVGGGALPGGFVLAGDDAFPLAECRNYDGTTAFGAAGAFHGKGRAVFLAHPAYLDGKQQLKDMPTLFKNAVKWLAHGKVNPKIAALRSTGMPVTLKNAGFPDATNVATVPKPGEYDVLLANGVNRDEVDKVLAFVQAGGGYMSGPLGWGYLYFNPSACFSEDFCENRISGTMGILMGTTGVNRIDGGFPTACDKIPDGTFADDAMAIALGEKPSTKQSLKQTTATLSQLVNTLPGGVRPELYTRLLSLSKHPDANKTPSPDAPVGAESVFARLAILAQKNAWLADPEKPVAASPGAAVYPGLVKPGTPKIEKTIDVDLSVPLWHSTGVYAVPGEPLTVTLGKDALKLGLKARIGSTADDLSGLAEWKRHPAVTCEVPLVKETTTFYNPFGGLVYIVVPDRGNLSGVKSVKLAGGVMAPWFKLGRDTNESFAEQCRTSGAPYGEIQSKDFVVIAETAGLKRVDDATWIAEYWDKVLGACQHLAQWKTRRHPERICSDIQLIAGWMHDGYPLMTHVNDEHFDWAINKENLMSGDAWGCYHEIGHNHQNRDWTPDGTGEVTVNLFTTYTIERVSGANIRDGRFPTSRQQAARRVKNWVARGKKFNEWKGDYFLALEPYIRIKEAYGWDAFIKTFARYLEPGFVRPKNDSEKWQIFAKELSKTVNADMAAVLAAWSIPLTAETKAFGAKFPAAKESLTAGLVKTPYVPPATEPVAGDYLALNLAGKDAGTIETFATREAVPGGEQDLRWKTTAMLFRRIEPTEKPFTLGNHAAPTNSWEAPHPVEITKPYYIGVYEVTQEQYFHVMEQWRANCWGAKGDRETRPVNGISYNEIRGAQNDGIDWPKTGGEVASGSFLGKLRALAGYRAEFDLPTEAQWEYAGRALTTGAWNNGEEGKDYADEKTKFRRNDNLDKLARYSGNGGESGVKDDPLMKSGVKTPYGTAAVGSYAPNAWGIYDMHGNAYEWCRDWWAPVPESQGAYSGKDPAGPMTPGVDAKGKPKAPRRTMRGGSWWNSHFGSPGQCVIWCRELGRLCDPGTGHGAAGFRVALPAAVAPKPLAGPDADPLSPFGFETRKTLLDGVQNFGSKGLPGPVYVLGGDAMAARGCGRLGEATLPNSTDGGARITEPREVVPLIAAKNWDGSPACVLAVATYGKGRVAVVPDDTLDASEADNARLFENLKKWLGRGKWFGRGYSTVNLAAVDEAEIDALAAKVADGHGLLCYGRAWLWKQAKAEKGETVVLADWPSNKLLAAFGLGVGDFCVRRTSSSGFGTRAFCEKWSTAVSSDFYSAQKFPAPHEPVVRPVKAAGAEGILLKDGETIAFLGDSITRLGAGEKGYISLVMKGLEVAGVKNLDSVRAGIDGQHAGDMRGRLGGILANPEVKAITISCGVNDVWGFDWGRGQNLEEYKANVRAMYDRAALAGVQVVALTPTLCKEEPDNEQNRLLDTFADFIRAEAKARGLPLADCRAAEIEGLKRFPPESGLHYTYDGVHPVWEGNVLIAKEVLKALGVPAKYDAAIAKAWDEIKAKK